MNGTQRELRRDTGYRFPRDGAHFSVPVQQVAPQTNISPRCDSRGVRSRRPFHGLDVLWLYQAWANSGPGATWGPLSFIIQPVKLKENILLLVK